jgi:hypothetical protein
MANNYLNTDDIINWINQWSVNNPEPSKLDIEHFARALNEKMLEINYKVSSDGTVIGYAGKLKDGGTGIFETVRNLTENSNGNYIFINNSADNILNNTDFHILFAIYAHLWYHECKRLIIYVSSVLRYEFIEVLYEKVKQNYKKTKCIIYYMCIASCNGWLQFYNRQQQ